MEYFVTGATGFLGENLVEVLVGDGHDVVALARTPDTADRLRELGVEVVDGDVTDRESLREPMAGVDGVFHAAAIYRLGVDDPSFMRRVNVGGTRNVLELVGELDVPKAVYTSTLAVNSDTGGEVVDESYRFDGEHLSAYDRTKAEAHDVAAELAADGVPVVTVMPGPSTGRATPASWATSGGTTCGDTSRSSRASRRTAWDTSSTSRGRTSGRWSGERRARPTSSRATR